MSEADTIALVRRYIDAFNAGDRDAMLACLFDDVAHDINEGERQIGKDKFRWFLGMMDRHYRERLEDVVVMAGQGGGRGAAEFTVHGTYLSTAEGLPEANGQTYALPAGIFFEVDDGLISRVTTYYNLADWTAQVEKG
ncbi:MAG: nuclear transport factor 2 family protein [Aquamicrobium sp.]|uniref:ketosteroid isomerase-related protein n=1 Tax=Aquamicrobium sp. TaxID=1872579 RepID=UPI00349EF76B|nr:nuclear transport factor 2 family protein [Aquamicrobium sp.]